MTVSRGRRRVKSVRGKPPTSESIRNRQVCPSCGMSGDTLYAKTIAYSASKNKKRYYILPCMANPRTLEREKLINVLLALLIFKSPVNK